MERGQRSRHVELEDPANNLAEETTQLIVVGGSSFRIAAASGGGVRLTWSPDGTQAGFTVVRLAGGITTTFPATGPLPANTGSFVDASPVAHAFNCYTVVPVDGAGAAFGRSTLLCIQTDTASPTGAPGFTLGLDPLGATALLTWAAPAGSWMAIRVHPLDGSPAWQRNYSGRTSRAAIDTNGVNTCYVLYPFALDPWPPTASGNSDVMCVVPGFATIQ